MRELITPVLLTKNVMRQSCKDQGFVKHILKIKLEQLGKLTKNKEMCASAFYINIIMLLRKFRY